MINEQLINPKSIVVVGASNNLQKPGGKILNNIIQGEYDGALFVVNPKEREVQGIKSYSSVSELPDVDLAVIAIAAKHCPATIELLTTAKNTSAFIVLSAGFSEVNEEGSLLEEQMVAHVNKVNGCLIGPNCIGVLNQNYQGVFTTPIPTLTPKGCDFISSSGATAVFVMEAGSLRGLHFSSVFSVGNGTQTSVEDVLEYMDTTYDAKTSSAIKLLYIENISNPEKLLKYASSLIQKGCKIAAIKAGATEAGSRAAASHTGAIANSDMATRALFRKAGIVYCSSREELITVGSIFAFKELEGKNIAVITHAGGSAVMLSDALSKGGLKVPEIEGEDADELLSYLYPGSSVSNPIDFLATGTAEQLGIIIDYCEHKFDEIDAMVVVFGSPGLFDVENVYKVLSVKLDVCKKPIYPVLPSVINAQKEINYFLSKGHCNFPDEVILGSALTEVYNTPSPSVSTSEVTGIDTVAVRSVIDSASDGFLPVEEVNKLFKAIGVPITEEYVVTTEKEALEKVSIINFPLVMKVVGPIHKSDTNGVLLNVTTPEEVKENMILLMAQKNVTGVLMQPMLSGIELFTGVKRESNFGHLILVGLGGIFVEVLKDVQAGLAPLNKEEVTRMIRGLQGYPLIEGVRGQEGVDEDKFVDIILRISALVGIAPEIEEMDVNPFIGNKNNVIAVDARIKIEKLS